jgi:hypothetical protein
VLSVRYNDRGFIRTQFLVYTPAMTQNPFAAGALSYTLTQRLPNTGQHRHLLHPLDKTERLSDTAALW